MKSDYIFGISERIKNSGCTIEPGRVSLAYDLMLGTPCLMLSNQPDKTDKSDKESLLLRSKKELGLTPKKEEAAVVPFHTRGVRKRISTSSTNRELKLMADPSIKLLNRTDLDVFGIDLDKIPKALDFVREKGPLTLFVDNSKSTLKELKSFLEFMYGQFPVVSSFRFFNNEVGNFSGNIQTAVTLIDVKDVYPIYNTEKVDGVLVDITAYNKEFLKKNDGLSNHFMEMTQVFSKFPENIIEVDGQQLPVNSHVKVKDALNFMDNHRQFYK